MLNFFINNGQWIALIGGFIATVGVLLTTLQSNRAQEMLRSKVEENAKLQEKLKQVAEQTLKNIEHQNLLSSTIEWITIRMYLKNVKTIEDLNDAQLFCEVIKPNILNPGIFIDIPGTDNLGPNVKISGKTIKELTKTSITYDLWTKGDQDEAFHKLNTSIAFHKGLLEGIFYISPEKLLRTLKVRDFNDGLVRVLINSKFIQYVRKIEFLLNDSIVLNIDQDNWRVDKANMTQYPKNPNGVQPKQIVNNEWFLIGEIREDTYGVGPYKLQLNKIYK